MSNFASDNSKWLKNYSEKVNKTRQKSNGNKWIIPVVFVIMIGGFIGIMIANGGLTDPQKFNAIKIMGGIGGFMLILSIILIATGKKKVASSRTSDNLNELIRSAEEAAAFDEQMAQSPLFSAEIPTGNLFATKDYLGKKFSHMGDETYEFVRIKDIASLHYTAYKEGVIAKSYIIDLRDSAGKVMMNASIENRAKLDSFIENLKTVLPGLEITVE